MFYTNTETKSQNHYSEMEFTFSETLNLYPLPHDKTR